MPISKENKELYPVTEWRIVTKDGYEYTGNRLKFEGKYLILYRLYKIKYSKDVRDWHFLGLRWKTIKWDEDVEKHDYIIPESEVKRIERRDIVKKDSDRKI